MDLLNGLYTSEVILLVSGALLFSVLLGILILTFLRDHRPKNKGINAILITLFPLSVFMMGYSGIQKLTYENGKIELERAVRQVQDNPGDPATKRKLQKTVDRFEERSTSDPNRLLLIAQAYAALGQREKATVLFDSSRMLNSDSTAPAASSGGMTDPAKVRALAKACGLTAPHKPNGHLAFRDGDIRYWARQGLDPDALCLQFTARRKVLEEASRRKRRIATQGDLSFLAEKKIDEGLRKGDCCD